MNSARILIASSALADAELAAASLGGAFKGVTIACRAESALADFERCKPEVLVLAFHDLGEAERHCLALRSSAEFGYAPPHRVVVLCRSEDVPNAYRMCESGQFDDYVQFWPMTFDIFRLRMSVLHAVRDLRADRRLEGPTSELVALPHSITGAQSMDPQVAAVLQAAAMHAQAERQRSGQFRHQVHPLSGPAEALAQRTGALHREPAASSSDIKAQGRQTVLVIEDDEFQQKILARMVGKENMQCDVAGTGAAALDAVGRHRPALILLDYMLPDIDGVALLRTFKSMPALAAVPIIMLTGNGLKEVVVASMQAGASAFMVKPITAELLREKLRHFVPALV